LPGGGRRAVAGWGPAFITTIRSIAVAALVIRGCAGILPVIGLLFYPAFIFWIFSITAVVHVSFLLYAKERAHALVIYKSKPL
jgi:hypothetical protein